MKVRIDYLNKEKEERNIIVDVWEVYDDIYEVDNIWFEIVEILKQGATDVRVYKLTKKND